jgi:hypothetical protein
MYLKTSLQQPCLAICILVLGLAPDALRAQQIDFSGDWQTYWRTGSAVLSPASRRAIAYLGNISTG